jgi:hypothetical protein
MASISVVLLGLNPDTRIRPVIDYCRARGVEAGAVPQLLLQHPRIFEYKVRGLSGDAVGMHDRRGVTPLQCLHQHTFGFVGCGGKKIAIAMNTAPLVCRTA